MAKVDIKSAFRLVPIHPADRHLLAIKWRDELYIDGCLPFGLHLAAKLFNILADLVSWIAVQEGVTCIFHYLDNFLIIGPHHSPICEHSLNIFMHLCQHLSILLASRSPLPLSPLLGIVIDTA